MAILKTLTNIPVLSNAYTTKGYPNDKAFNDTHHKSCFTIFAQRGVAETEIIGAVLVL